jgi:hypothetical protein
MQYILTEYEYLILKQEPLDIQREADRVIADLCKQVADHFPIEQSWKEEKEPWVCIRSMCDGEEHCCGRCPVQDICTYKHKEWSQ